MRLTGLIAAVVAIHIMAADPARADDPMQLAQSSATSSTRAPAKTLFKPGSLPMPAQPANWTEAVEPFRIAGNIYYVGTQGLAAYLIGSERGAILIDGTLAENAALVLRNIAATGIPFTSIKILLSNHAHDDHAGALARLKRETGATMMAAAADRVALERGSHRGDNIYRSRDFPPVKVDKVIADDASISAGDVTLRALLTPGHTPGCTSFTMTVEEAGRKLDVLFLCSITVAGNILVGNKAYPAIAEDYRETFARLGRVKADIVLTAHPEVADVLGRAARVKAGEADAFIDPQLLAVSVARARAAFDEALKQQEGR